MSFGDTYITVMGRIGSEPDFKELGQTPQVSFRLASTPRQFEKALNTYVDKPTTWYTVECWRTLARNAFESIGLGHPVIVTGRLRTHEWTDDSGEPRSRVILEAFSLGHDLNRGTATFTKNAPRSELFGPTAQTPEVTAAPYPPDEFTTTPLPLPTERPAAA